MWRRDALLAVAGVAVVIVATLSTFDVARWGAAQDAAARVAGTIATSLIANPKLDLSGFVRDQVYQVCRPGYADVQWSDLDGLRGVVVVVHCPFHPVSPFVPSSVTAAASAGHP